MEDFMPRKKDQQFQKSQPSFMPAFASATADCKHGYQFYQTEWCSRTLVALGIAGGQYKKTLTNTKSSSTQADQVKSEKQKRFDPRICWNFTKIPKSRKHSVTSIINVPEVVLSFPHFCTELISNAILDENDHAYLISNLSCRTNLVRSLSRYRRFPDSSKAFYCTEITGSHNISLVFLKYFKFGLSPILVKLFNCLFKEKCLLSLWKVSLVCPVLTKTHMAAHNIAISVHWPTLLLSVNFLCLL